MSFTNTKIADSLSVAPTGRLDSVNAPELDAFLKASLGDITKLTFDFSGLEYISSAGLRVLLWAHREMKQKGTMVVKNVNAEIMEIFTITGFTDILTIK